MTRRYVSRMAGVVVGIVGVLGATRWAAANTASFAFTMEHRAVLGKMTGVYHSLTAGDLTIEGEIWITGRDPRTSISTPDTVSIEVLEKTTMVKHSICTVQVTPDRIFNRRIRYSLSCGHIDTGEYWLSVSKKKQRESDGDGWHSQGAGKLTTK